MSRKNWWLAGAVGVAAAYPFYETRRYGVDRLDVPVSARAPRLDVLHISDTHFKEGSRRLAGFIRSIPERMQVPDFVVVTGDLIERDSGIALACDALNALPARRGRFYVLGSHDYYQSKFQSYAKYWLAGGRVRPDAPRADTARLEDRLQAQGWIPLHNRVEMIDLDGSTVRVAGIDDVHLKRHSTAHIGTDRRDDLAIGLVHVPEIVSEWALNSFDLVLAGHTHGGQVRIPGIGAVVTNCELPAGLSAGLSRVGATWLHVSPGLAHGRFAPIRFNCPPRATLLSLRPEPDPQPN